MNPVKRIAYTLAAGLLAASASAEVPHQPRAAGIETKGYVWNKPDQEQAKALKRKGDIEKGKAAYKGCQGCHKPDASGRAEEEFPQLAGQHATVLIKQMVDVRAGRRDNPKMHPFVESEVVSGDEVADIAAYLNSLPVPASNGKGDGRALDKGKTLYERDCALCHGDSGEGVAKKFYPKVAAQHYKYLLRESREIRDGGRRNALPKMVKVIKKYSDNDLEAVADYMSRLPPPGK